MKEKEDWIGNQKSSLFHKKNRTSSSFDLKPFPLDLVWQQVRMKQKRHLVKITERVTEAAWMKVLFKMIQKNKSQTDAYIQGIINSDSWRGAVQGKEQINKAYAKKGKRNLEKDSVRGWSSFLAFDIQFAKTSSRGELDCWFKGNKQKKI